MCKTGEAGWKMGPAFPVWLSPFPGEICCLVGREQFYPLVGASLDMQSMISFFFFYTSLSLFCFVGFWFCFVVVVVYFFIFER